MEIILKNFIEIKKLSTIKNIARVKVKFKLNRIEEKLRRSIKPVARKHVINEIKVSGRSLDKVNFVFLATNFFI